jgi:hypothetical protein
MNGVNETNSQWKVEEIRLLIERNSGRARLQVKAKYRRTMA